MSEEYREPLGHAFCDQARFLSILVALGPGARAEAARPLHVTTLSSEKEVGRGKRVAHVAMRFRGIDSGSPRPAKNVLFVCNGFQVGRINASAVAAEVVKVHSRRNWPHEDLVAGTVNSNIDAAALYPAIAICECAAPNAAAAIAVKRPIDQLDGDFVGCEDSRSHVNRSNGLCGQGWVERSNAPRPAIYTRNRAETQQNTMIQARAVLAAAGRGRP